MSRDRDLIIIDREDIEYIRSRDPIAAIVLESMIKEGTAEIRAPR